MLSSKLNVLSHYSIPSGQIWKIPSQTGFWIQTSLSYLQNWTFLSHNSIPSDQIRKILSQTGVVFFSRWSFWVPTILCYLQNWMFCPITLFKVVRFGKFLLNQGSFSQDNCLEYQQSYVIFKNWTFHAIFLFISILIALCLHKPYFLLFNGNFDSLEWQFEIYCFM